MKSGILLLRVVVLMLAAVSVLAGQQRTRSEEVEALRRQKAAESRPEQGSRVEAVMPWMQERS
jgi:hypothetical protein